MMMEFDEVSWQRSHHTVTVTVVPAAGGRAAWARQPAQTETRAPLLVRALGAASRAAVRKRRGTETSSAHSLSLQGAEPRLN